MAEGLEILTNAFFPENKEAVAGIFKLLKSASSFNATEEAFDEAVKQALGSANSSLSKYLPLIVPKAQETLKTEQDALSKLTSIADPLALPEDLVQRTEQVEKSLTSAVESSQDLENLSQALKYTEFYQWLLDSVQQIFRQIQASILERLHMEGTFLKGRCVELLHLCKHLVVEDCSELSALRSQINTFLVSLDEVSTIETLEAAKAWAMETRDIVQSLAEKWTELAVNNQEAGADRKTITVLSGLLHMMKQKLQTLHANIQALGGSHILSEFLTKLEKKVKDAEASLKKSRVNLEAVRTNVVDIARSVDAVINHVHAQIAEVKAIDKGMENVQVGLPGSNLIRLL